MIDINNIYNLDCLQGLASIDDCVVDLTVTSPPYDGLRTYQGHSEQFTFDKFQSIAKELYRVTKDNGVLVWVVSDATINGDETCTSFKQALYFREIGFKLYDTMIWEKSGMLPTKKHYYNIFEYMFVFCKGDQPKTINLIADRVNLTSGKTSRTTTSPISKDTGRPVVGASYITQEKGVRTNIWRIPVGNSNNNPTGHPAVFPQQLVEDHIKSWSNEGDLVLDPFMGGGTTARASINLDRRFIGFEICEDYFSKTVASIEDYQRLHENSKRQMLF